MATFVDITKENFDEFFPKKEKLDTMREEIRNWSKCVKGNHDRFVALTQLQIIDGASMDSESCAPIDRNTLVKILKDSADHFINGNMKVDGKRGNWSVGEMGSRWADFDAEKYGIDYIRAAFYSKKNYKGVWKSDKPYLIRITAEKGA